MRPVPCFGLHVCVCPDFDGSAVRNIPDKRHVKRRRHGNTRWERCRTLATRVASFTLPSETVRFKAYSWDSTRISAQL